MSFSKGLQNFIETTNNILTMDVVDSIRHTTKATSEIWHKVSVIVEEVGVKPIAHYSEIIEYFLNEKPDDSQVYKAALLREKYNGDYRLIQVFLNKDNDLVCDQDGCPYGRKLVVREIDEELSDFFGDESMIIFE